MDPDLFRDMTKFQPYIYSEERSDATVARNQQLGRVFLAVMLDGEPIGEIVLKNIDYNRSCCTLGIHLQNDSLKNRGYGTQAEILAVQYAFQEMGLAAVYADVIHNNKRSQHVLEKIGFLEISRDDAFIYYECRRESWKPPNDR